MGNMQLRNEATDSLEIVANRGFTADFLEHFSEVDATSGSACSRALATRRRVLIPDVTKDTQFAPHLAAATAAGFRAVQSTPLLSRTGRVLGVLSTHYVQPHTPSERDLRLLDVCAQQASDYIDRRRFDEQISSSLLARESSERRYQQLFNSIDEGFGIVEVLFNEDGKAYDYRFLDTNAAFEKNTGLTDVVGRTMRQLTPKHEPMWFETYGRIAQTGVPERFEGFAEALERYLDVYAFRTEEPSERRVAILLRDVSERKAAEERQKLLLGELNHRVKNTLTTVQSLANQTMIGAESPEYFVDKFRGRLATLAEAHNLLAQANWEGAELTGILDKLLSFDGDGERVAVSGPKVVLRPQPALSLSLVLYELGTNARKYGALSQPQGRVRVSWNVAARNGDEFLDLDWIERDGPTVSAPAKSGFGKALIEQSLKGVGGQSVLQFLPGGVSCRILLPLQPDESGG
jgi:PAS domain S-box-containing protein